MSRVVRADVRATGLLSFQGGPVAVLTNSDSTAGTPGAPKTTQSEPMTVDNYTTRLVKYIPAELISFNLAADKTIQALAKSSDPTVFSELSQHYPAVLPLIVFVLSAVALPFYYKAASDQDQPLFVNVVISLIAFTLWSYATEGRMWDATGLKLFDPSIASFAILAFTFIVGFIVPAGGKKSAPGDNDKSLQH